MNINIFTAIIILFYFLSGCGDPQLEETSLPNGFFHHSNGGNFGTIDAPNDVSANKIGLPFVNPNNDLWCDKFGWADNLIVCELARYGDRAFIDPPKKSKMCRRD